MIALISDIHGNHAALLAVLDELDRIGVENTICLGDIGGYYCQINQCCETLRTRGIFSLMGNHDWYLTSGSACPRSNSANHCLDYQRKTITCENLNWLSSLTHSAHIEGIEIVHGGWNDPIDEYLVPTAEYFSELPGLLFASGHTHMPTIWSDGHKSYCNPGSVGQPRDGDPRASFATWNGEKFALHRISYDIAALEIEMRAAGFDEYYYKNLRNGTRIGG